MDGVLHRTEQCPECHGSGAVDQYEDHGNAAYSWTVACRFCDGSGNGTPDVIAQCQKTDHAIAVGGNCGLLAAMAAVAFCTYLCWDSPGPLVGVIVGLVAAVIMWGVVLQIVSSMVLFWLDRKARK